MTVSKVGIKIEREEREEREGLRVKERRNEREKERGG
jgi:hypothetical protein